MTGLAIMLTALAIPLEFEFLPRGAEFVTLLTGLAMIACLSGWRVAVVAVALSAGASWWLFLAGGAPAASAIAIYAAGGLATVALVEALTRAALAGIKQDQAGGDSPQAPAAPQPPARGPDSDRPDGPALLPKWFHPA